MTLDQLKSLLISQTQVGAGAGLGIQRCGRLHNVYGNTPVIYDPAKWKPASISVLGKRRLQYF